MSARDAAELVLFGLLGAFALLAFVLAFRNAVDAARERADTLRRGDDPGRADP